MRSALIFHSCVTHSAPLTMTALTNTHCHSVPRLQQAEGWQRASLIPVAPIPTGSTANTQDPAVPSKAEEMQPLFSSCSHCTAAHSSIFHKLSPGLLSRVCKTQSWEVKCSKNRLCIQLITLHQIHPGTSRVLFHLFQLNWFCG